MTKTKKKIIKITVISLSVLVLVYVIFYAIVFYMFFSRNYEADLVYNLTRDGELLIIKRWRWLAAEGADVHYERDWKSASVYLGEVLYSSDYEIREVDEDTVCVSWGADRSETYDLPKDVPLSPWLWVGIGGAVVVICGAVVTAVILRRKRRRAAAASDPAVPGGSPPTPNSSL